MTYDTNSGLSAAKFISWGQNVEMYLVLPWDINYLDPALKKAESGYLQTEYNI